LGFESTMIRPTTKVMFAVHQSGAGYIFIIKSLAHGNTWNLQDVV